MHHLFTISRTIKESIEAGAHLLLLLDFDGTLAPIVGNPSEAFLPGKTKDALEALKQKSWCTIAILSGRQLDDLVARIGVQGIIYGGNHGVQLRGPGIDFQASLSTETIDALRTIAYRLGSLSSSVNRVLVENKGSSLSVHYRNVEPLTASTIPDLVGGIIQPFLDVGFVRARQGKKVIDITADSWDKGKAVTWLFNHATCSNGRKGRLLTVYIGDDTTDEDAFSVVSENGFAILVGKKKTSRASYFVKNTDEVYSFLLTLATAKQPDIFPGIIP